MFTSLPLRHRLLLLAFTLLLLCGCLGPGASVEGQLPGGLTVWQGVIRIYGDLIVPADAELRILPGTEVIFMDAGELDRFRDHPHFPGSELIVYGRLIAEGEADAPIRFRFHDPAAARGSWGGINLVASPGARFAYCLFRQADSAIHSQESQVVIFQSVFEENLVAIRFHSSEIVIEHNLIRGNDAGIRFHFGAPQIRFNRIADNRKGLFITSEPRDLQILDNAFLENRPYQVVLGAEVVEDVDLSGNWWSEPDIGVLRQRIFDADRDPDLGRVRLEPTLHGIPEKAGPSWTP